LADIAFEIAVGEGCSVEIPRPIWNYKMLMVGLGLGALLPGVVAAKGVWPPLIFRGLAIVVAGGFLWFGM